MDHPSGLTLFVYGTLMPGQAQAARLGPLHWEVPAHTPGRLYHLPAGYPALVLDPTSTVYGVVVVLAEPERLSALDDYEGPLYHRERCWASTPEGPVEAWCWRVRAADLPAGAQHLRHGRWSGP